MQSLNSPIARQKSFVYLKKTKIDHDQQSSLNVSPVTSAGEDCFARLTDFSASVFNSQPSLRISIMKDFVIKSGWVETGEGQPIYFTSSIDQAVFHPHGASSLKLDGLILKASAIGIWRNWISFAYIMTCIWRLSPPPPGGKKKCIEECQCKRMWVFTIYHLVVHTLDFLHPVSQRNKPTDQVFHCWVFLFLSFTVFSFIFGWVTQVVN